MDEPSATECYQNPLTNYISLLSAKEGKIWTWYYKNVFNLLYAEI